MKMETIPVMENPETDYDCFVWCGVVAITCTNEQTHTFFQARFEEIGENLDEFSIARGKKEILTIVEAIAKEYK